MQWKASNERKPLLLKGARQVGKTYLLKAFGKREFQNVHYFDFTKDKKLQSVFADQLDPGQIIKRLEIQYEQKIYPEKDLIIFDEIQECPRAITSLKYFCDDLKNSYVIGSGSFLGLSLSPDSYPVGKVTTQTLYPMSFFEFLKGLEKTSLLDEITHGTPKGVISKTVHEKAWEYLKYYFITGGLPEVVQIFKNNSSDMLVALRKVRERQSELLENYLNDMSKHSGKTNAVKIQAVFKNAPLQLARENKTSPKFVFKNVLATRSNYEQLEDPIEWLVQAGLVYKISICKRAEAPLKAYTDPNKFKLFLFDVGMLGLMVGLEPKNIFNYDYGSYKGYFAENFVVEELVPLLERGLTSWQEGTSEIEFLMESAEPIIPIEVKAGINTKAKSLRIFMERYQPKQSFLISGNPLVLNKTGLSYVPLYSTSLLKKLVV
jgi:predicted AAA+ superfamily ATPase